MTSLQGKTEEKQRFQQNSGTRVQGFKIQGLVLKNPKHQGFLGFKTLNRKNRRGERLFFDEKRERFHHESPIFRFNSSQLMMMRKKERKRHEETLFQNYIQKCASLLFCSFCSLKYSRGVVLVNARNRLVAQYDNIAILLTTYRRNWFWTPTFLFLSREEEQCTHKSWYSLL